MGRNKPRVLDCWKSVNVSLKRQIIYRNMITTPILLILNFFFSCSDRTATSDIADGKVNSEEIEVPEFQNIIDSALVSGAILIYDLERNAYYSNDYSWSRKGFLPASTFKIPNSIIALETSVVEDEHTLFKWDGESRRIKNWEQDLILRDAFHFSCVPCYQDVARKIGVKDMTEFLDKLEYGNIKVDSVTLDLFWLQGESRISQFQQIDFLKRFYQSELPITERTEEIMKKMMVIEDNGNYKISGKTGWSVSDGIDNGWFVGYLQTQDNTYFFASNVKPKELLDMELFPEVRKDVIFKAFQQMSILE